MDGGGFKPQFPTEPYLAVTDRGAWAAAFSIVFFFIATTSVVLRYLSRRLTNVRFGWDDYLIVGALAFQWILVVSNLICIFAYGLGQHMMLLSVHQMEEQLKWQFVTTISFWGSVCLGKSSLVLLYLKIFPSTVFKRVAMVVLLGLLGLWIGGMYTTLDRCHPIEANWQLGVSLTACKDTQAGWLGTGITNILFDFIILCLPLPHVMRLHLPAWRLRFAIFGLLCLGCLTVLASILRVVISLKGDYMDFTYTSIQPDMFGLLEPTVMIFCACAPMMRPLYRFWRNGTRTARSRAVARTPREGSGSGLTPRAGSKGKLFGTTLFSNTTQTGANSSARAAPSANPKHASMQGFTYLEDDDEDLASPSTAARREKEADLELGAVREMSTTSSEPIVEQPRQPVHGTPALRSDAPPASPRGPAQRLEAWQTIPHARTAPASPTRAAVPRRPSDGGRAQAARSPPQQQQQPQSPQQSATVRDKFEHMRWS